MPPVTRKQIKAMVSRHDKLKGDRATFESLWQTAMEVIQPRKAYFTKEHLPGDYDQSQVYNSTQTIANERLAGNMHGLLTNPDGQWFEIITADESTSRAWAAGVWLEVVMELIRRNIRDSNFDSQMHETYLDEGAIGSSLLLQVPGEGPGPYGSGLRFQSLTVAECVLAENAAGIIDTLFRQVPMSVRQAAMKFGENRLSRDHQRLLETQPDAQVKFLHCVYPREDVIPGAYDRFNKPWASIYIDPESEMSMRESGYDEWPLGVSRWTKLSGEIYGRGPGLTALPDILMLQRKERTQIRAEEKATDPPLLLPDDGVLRPVKLGAGTLNYYDATRQDVRTIMGQLPVGNPGIGADSIMRLEAKIMSIFLADLFDLKESPQMTATEAALRDERQRRALSPVAGRHKAENLRPTIVRAFGILWRQGQIPPPPPELVNQQLMINYTTPIARSTRMAEAEGLQYLMGAMMPMLQINPQVADNFNWDELARLASELFSIPKRAMQSNEAVAQIREQRQQMIQAQQQLELARQAGESIEQAGRAGAAVEQAKQLEAQNQPQQEAI
uniref:Putative head tail connector protein n=1 Tax=viral metagenome TaxID=1070528 RepID=A0A6H1ZDP3_9ZZZZ